MFSFQPRDELDHFPTSTTSSQIPHDLRMDHSLLQSNFICFSAAPANQEQLLPSPRPRRAADRSKHEGGAAHVRRFMHREIERKRRQEMSTLYASLRTLLPLDHHSNKGKSSVCDQMEEAEKYIKQMHKKIKELGSRRDKLKKLYNSSSSRRENVEISADVDDTLNNCVSIHKVLHGLEILVTIKSPHSELSPVLAELVERDLDVVSCVSTRTKAGFLHKLQIDHEATDMASLDLAELHDRLIEAMKD